MAAEKQITDLIPHRSPFLWVDRITSFEDEGSITTEKLINADLDLFKGHYPDNPIMPGVLLCEIIFQTGALLIAKMVLADNGLQKNVPVITRIERAKFKRPVHPGDTAVVKVVLKEIISAVYFLKGTLRVGGKTAVQVGFSCALIKSLEDE
ncbi:MAG: beta-hydroxyacyl-ACP dehydratase [Desulfobulbaceae bacterium S5133MH15]|nr:MAG: beta-hydroxyacyl-ACP dehydratase [Desulfobulbaceae bacterium S5133MH15]